nr:MAG TPA: hypothetical protein [Caudoviricetes sp.]
MRLIDAKRLEAHIKEAFRENPVVMGIMLRWIRKQPTVDAVEIVRCRDCKNFKTYKCNMQCSDYDDFCSFGKRKDNDEF